MDRLKIQGEEGVRSWRTWEGDDIETIDGEMALITIYCVYTLCSHHFCFLPELLRL